MSYEKLKRELNRQNISIFKLSHLTGIHSPDLYNALNGKKPFYQGWRKRIAQSLNVEIKQIFDDDLTTK